jgi:ATP-binding cassette subfamily B (MDR/TAP) protein 1
MSSVPYVNAVKSIMHAMFCTRANILHAISVVSRFMRSLGKVY